MESMRLLSMGIYPNVFMSPTWSFADMDSLARVTLPSRIHCAAGQGYAKAVH